MKAIIPIFLLFSPLFSGENFDLKGNEEVLELQCGDGERAAKIAKLVPEGAVIALDHSRKLIEMAKTRYGANSNLTFGVGGLNQLDGKKRFDLITAIAASEWLPNQASLLFSLERSLKADGRAIVEIPREVPTLLEKTLREVLANAKWGSYFPDFTKESSPQKVGELAREAKLKPLKVEVIEQQQIFASKDLFKAHLRENFLSLQKLPQEMQDELLDEIVKSYLRSYPPDQKGRVHYAREKLLIQVQK